MSDKEFEKEDKYINNDTNIFLIHGIGSNTLSFLPLKLYLNRYGFKKVYSIDYPVNKYEFEESLKIVNNKIIKILNNDDNKEIVVIGQSFGGNISNSLHKMGRNIIKSICICSPLHGAKLVNMIESKIPKFVSNILRNKPFEYLKDKDDDEKPPHDFHTISFGWFTSDFDGCVYKHETMLDPEKHTHITWTDHRTGFLDPRLFKEVFKVLTCKTFIRKIKDKIEKKEKYSDL